MNDKDIETRANTLKMISAFRYTKFDRLIIKATKNKHLKEIAFNYLADRYSIIAIVHCKKNIKHVPSIKRGVVKIKYDKVNLTSFQLFVLFLSNNFGWINKKKK